MIEDLHLHQVELKMQTEELMASQADLLESRQKYADLFDFAPVGYVTIDENDRILEANLTFAQQVTSNRGNLTSKRFTEFIHPDDQDAFYLFRKTSCDPGKLSFTELRLKRNKAEFFWTRLDCRIRR